MEIQQELLNALDIDYSYRLAKKMEQFRTHPELGYRTSGSRAEFQTGEMLKEEMERIGLCSVFGRAASSHDLKRLFSPTPRRMEKNALFS